MGIVKVSNILRLAKDYLLSLQEGMMFDWLVVKQEAFGVGKPFRASISQVQKATRLSRRQQDNAIKHFTELKFLKVTSSYYNNNPYRTYYIDFAVLGKPEVLSEIIANDSETFREFSQWISILSSQQNIPQNSCMVEGLDFSIVPEDMRLAVGEWVSFKKEQKKAYTASSFVKCVKLLKELSGGEAEKAKEIIDYSIANNYSGLISPPNSKEVEGMEVGRIITKYDRNNFDRTKDYFSDDGWQT
jgi:hypothetical protein